MKLKFHHTSLFYTVTGRGPAIVLLHGFLESGSMWQQLAQILTKEHTVIVIDLPGHGKSGVVDEIHTMELMAEAVHDIVKHLGVTSISILGHSMGGYVALAYAELFPSEVEGLILLNSIPAEDSPERKANRDRALKMLHDTPKVFIRMAIANLFAEEDRFQYASAIEQLKEEALQFPLEGITAAVKGMRDRKDRTSVLRQFAGPKYMICGTKDPIVPLPISEILAKHCHTELIKVVGGHLLLTENYDEIIKKMHFIDFLSF
ncbi:alpha/beta hydrolase [Altibacter sp.]|uniref:alpha/beta fold hydrolase n=1 Tax=Altibacter sp. TaxID=2024823 RepID=UPI00258DD95D|nr:alpha/beta hydrolase [Altibacter sp.]MCW9037226.1 alpha/beta hydrolase [Altibacter sp.]